MRRSGRKSEIKYETSPHPNKRRSRKRKIIRFNPPYSEHVCTNIGREFLRLLTKNFPSTYRLHKTCNKRNVKLSYSCMPNMANLISKHNKTVVKRKTNFSSTTPPCNCRVKASRPLKKKCREKCIIYKATLTSDDSTMHYLGSCETEFKARFYITARALNTNEKAMLPNFQRHSGLTKPMEKALKLFGKLSYKPPLTNQGQGLACCVSQKSALFSKHIAYPATLLNKRTELMGKCRHINKFKLKNFS